MEVLGRYSDYERLKLVFEETSGKCTVQVPQVNNQQTTGRCCSWIRLFLKE